MKRVLSITFFLFAVFSNVIFSQNVYEFLRLDMSPRAAALAGSFVANTDDANVMFYNPAGIGSLKDQPVSFSFVKHLLDINSASLSYSRNFEKIGRFAVGVQYINYGNFTQADEFGNKTGEFGAGDFAFTLGYSNILDKNFYYGVNVKFIYSSIASFSSSAYAFDIGLQYKIPEAKWTIGFSVLNMGSQFSSFGTNKEDLPLDMRLGFSKTLAHLPLTLYFSFNKLSAAYNTLGERFNQFTFGGEIAVSKHLSFRLGYDNEKRSELKVGSTAGFGGFNLGLGINISNYRFDYAYSSLGSIGSLHRLGISTAL